MENSSTEALVKKTKPKKVSAFFRRVWKGLKSPFLRHDKEEGVDSVSQPEIGGSELLTDPSRPEVCLSHQVCDDHEEATAPGSPEMGSESLTSNGPGASADVVSPSEKLSQEEALPGPSKTSADVSGELEGLPSPPPETSSVDVPEENPKNRKKKKTVHSFFRKSKKTVKNLFHHGNPLPDQEDGNQESRHYDSSALDLQTLTLRSGFELGNTVEFGYYGNVYKASNIDGEKKQAAVVHWTKNERYLDVDGEPRPVLAEVALMLRLGTSCHNIIQLYDWVENDTGFILIVELPESCVTLDQFLTGTELINEVTARRLMLQVFQAAKHCFDRGVFHGDLHQEKILLTAPNFDLKLMDFGCAVPFNHEPLKTSDYHGNLSIAPPELSMYPTFLPGPAYVWQLGVVFLKIMRKCQFPDEETKLLSVSRDLIRKCLYYTPDVRPKLEEVERHTWFTLE